MPLNAGTKLGAYEILSPLGAGEQAEVCKAKDTRLNRLAAIKVLSSGIPPINVVLNWSSGAAR